MKKVRTIYLPFQVRFGKIMYFMLQSVRYQQIGAKFIMIPLAYCLLSFSTLHAQNTVSIKASATVFDMSEIELVTIKDMIIDETSAENGILNISPVTDVNAGIVLIKGRANAQMRITFPGKTLLLNTTGQGALDFQYITALISKPYSLRSSTRTPACFNEGILNS